MQGTMNSIVEAKVKDYLRNRYYVNPYDCGTIVDRMNMLARAAGHDLDERFARAGMGAGPEGRIAAGIVDLATLGGGGETPEYTIKQHLDMWVRTNRQLGR
jgi:hypothetical protein